MKHHRTKPKIGQKLLLFLVAMTLLFTAIPFTQSPITTYASGGSMTDEDGKGSTTIVGGPTSERTGWLFYVIDPKNNTQISSTVAWTSQWDITDRHGKPLPSGNIQLVSRYGVAANGWSIGTPWGPPYKDGAGRGSEVKQFMLEEYKDGKPYAYSLIEANWNKDLADKWLMREVYLAFEPFYWHHIYKNGVGTGVWYCDTSYGWGYMQDLLGLPEYGDKKLSTYTNGVYVYCVKLEDCQEIRDLGYTAPAPGKKTNAEMATKLLGSGIGIVWNDKQFQTTYDEAAGDVPSKPPHESEGTYTIVKNYRTHNLTDDTYTDDGCFSESLVGNEITIEDELSYKVVEWRITSTTNTNIPSIPWNPPGTTPQKGSTPTTIKIIPPSSCLYVLLEKVEEETPEELDANYIISQSSITRRIHLSNPDAQLSMPRIQDHTFTWVLGEHQTTCSGHTYYTACEGHSHKDSCPDDCSSSHNCGSNCVANTEYCSGFQWLDKTLKLSITNTLKNNYPDILSTKDDWRAESEQSKLTKHWYRNDATFERGSTSAVVYTDSGWDYVCVIHRGKDKLTVADWKNSSLAKSDLGDVSGSGYAVANTLQGTRKLVDFYDKFNNFNRLKRII